jgi:hypothetical protein
MWKSKLFWISSMMSVMTLAVLKGPWCCLKGVNRRDDRI